MEDVDLFQQEVATLIVSALELEVLPEDIPPEEPLFGGDGGLDLDSIDALELALVLGERYGIEFRSDDENNAESFSSLTALCKHIATMRTK